MAKNKQSSVEWLHQEHSKLLIEILSKKISLDQARVDYDELFLKAKNFHKDEIVSAYAQGVVDEGGDILDVFDDAINYYLENYTNEHI